MKIRPAIQSPAVSDGREGQNTPATENFYAQVEELTDFFQVVDEQHYTHVPSDWLLVITDVSGSTQAIEQGRYRDVNALGVSSIIALRNALSTIQFPFVFGGDGATLLVPRSVETTVRGTLVALSELAREAFSLELRCGVVPLAELYDQGHAVRVAKFRTSPHVSFAMLMGEGVAVAERWIKSEGLGLKYRVAEGSSLPLNMEGFECRWRPIVSRRGTMLSLLIQALPGEAGAKSPRYRAILERISSVLGDEAGHPVEARRMSLRGLFGDFSAEARVKSGTASGDAYKAMWLRAQTQSLIGKALMLLGKRAGGFDGATYMGELVRNCDFRKFDETLRMVVDVSPDQLKALTQILQEARARGEIAYGLHLSNKALVTCHVRAYSGDHLHFIDGDAGGYALAAKQLKTQLRNDD